MTSPVISATANTPVQDIAQLLLKNHISAVPILDCSPALLSAWLARATSSADGTAARVVGLALLGGGGGGGGFLSGLRRPERVAIEVHVKAGRHRRRGHGCMAEIARLLGTYRIKRACV